MMVVFKNNPVHVPLIFLFPLISNIQRNLLNSERQTQKDACSLQGLVLHRAKNQTTSWKQISLPHLYGVSMILSHIS